MIFLILCGGFTALFRVPSRSLLVTTYVGCVPISKYVLWHLQLAANKAIQHFLKYKILKNILCHGKLEEMIQNLKNALLKDGVTLLLNW